MSIHIMNRSRRRAEKCRSLLPGKDLVEQLVERLGSNKVGVVHSEHIAKQRFGTQTFG